MAGLLPVAAPPLARWLCASAGLDDAVLADRLCGFDAAHYQQSAGRRFRSRRAALLHYLLIGSPAGLQPRPGFDPVAYRRLNPDVAAAGYEPYAHYLRFGRAERRLMQPNKRLDDKTSIPDLFSLVAQAPRHNPEVARVDVVIPVYGARRLTLRALASVLHAKVDTPYELTVIDDASPDLALRRDLEALARVGHLTLLTNDRNMGFVATANRGFALHPGRDVVLLNSDTEVYGNWLDRLVAALHSTERTATASPLSNAATILSYPVFLSDYHALTADDWAAVDSICARLEFQPIELPTAHGFCMAVKRACLDEIGLFDQENFGRGYGEENDFSLRAIARGWRHVADTATFVWHYGGASFDTEREPLIAAAQETIERLHPGYAASVRDFIAADPLAPVREALDVARIRDDTRTKVLCTGAPRTTKEELALTLVSDIVPYAGSLRLIAPGIGAVPNLPRIRAGSKRELARIMRALAIREVRLSHPPIWKAELSNLVLRAAQMVGAKIS